MTRTLLYVSCSKVAFPDRGEIQNIVDVARARNSTLDVTGGLIATPKSFSQVLEGPSDAIDELMESICRDVRHEQVLVVLDHLVERRRFPLWAMAYSGPATYVQRLIDPLAAAPKEANAASCQRLIRFIHEYSTK